jgi:hypothetical protein
MCRGHRSARTWPSFALLGVNFSERFDPPSNFAREFLAKAEYGKLLADLRARTGDG